MNNVAASSTSSDSWLTNASLIARLQQCTTLPSPPAVAARIIELGQDPEVSIGDVAKAVSMDPALAAKILRIANSPLYGRRRKTENLRQAFILLGLNGTMTMALSFSLVTSLSSGQQGGGLDYGLFWRRSVLAATTARVLAAHRKLPGAEDYFLAALLQDLGMLALDRAVSDLYSTLGDTQIDQEAMRAAERERVGTDHAVVGAWLLERWSLPEILQQAVAGSHDPDVVQADDAARDFVRHTAAAGKLADVWLVDPQLALSEQLACQLQSWFNLDRESCLELLGAVAFELPDSAAAFEVELCDKTTAQGILDQAREILMLRNLQAIHEAEQLHQATESLHSRAQELEERNRRDPLTGLYNRAHLDLVLAEEFTRAQEHGWPLCVAFVDMDHFKSVNDTHGHQAGDAVLKAAAEHIQSSIRESDLAARYGGEEFLVVLPGVDARMAERAVNRILKALREHAFELPGGNTITATASIGLASVGASTVFKSVDDLVRAADEAVYAAKRAGRDCVVNGTY